MPHSSPRRSPAEPEGDPEVPLRAAGKGSAPRTGGRRDGLRGSTSRHAAADDVDLNREAEAQAGVGGAMDVAEQEGSMPPQSHAAPGG